jgi:hypothetical protein
MAKWLKNFLDKLAKANDEAFDGKIPDCCGACKDGESCGAKESLKDEV